MIHAIPPEQNGTASGSSWMQLADQVLAGQPLTAEQGLADAQNNLGDCYYHGHCVAQSYEEAVKWYRLSAKQGNAEGKKALAEAKKRLEIAKGCPSCGFNYSWNGMFCTHCKYQK